MGCINAKKKLKKKKAGKKHTKVLLGAKIIGGLYFPYNFYN